MNAPALILRLEIEAAPQLMVDALNTSERRRLFDWINSQPGLLELVHAAGELETLDRRQYLETDDATIPAGTYGGMTLAQVAARGVEGERWFVTMLARLGPFDWMRPSIEEFARERMPDVWTRYSAWRQLHPFDEPTA